MDRASSAACFYGFLSECLSVSGNVNGDVGRFKFTSSVYRNCLASYLFIFFLLEASLRWNLQRDL